MRLEGLRCMGMKYRFKNFGFVKYFIALNKRLDHRLVKIFNLIYLFLLFEYSLILFFKKKRNIVKLKLKIFEIFKYN